MNVELCDMLRLLFAWALAAAATTGLACFVRALPWPARLTAIKPLGCPVCMTGWAAFPVLGVLYHGNFLPSGAENLHTLGLLWFANIAVGAPIFAFVFPPPLAFPDDA